MSERWSDEHVHRVVEELDHDEVGMGMWEVHKRFAFVVNDVTRNVSVIDFNTQAVAGEKPENAIVVRAATLPAENSTEDKVRKGKRFFNTATGRWSLKGQGWNGCQSCHMDGLSDSDVVLRAWSAAVDEPRRLDHLAQVLRRVGSDERCAEHDGVGAAGGFSDGAPPGSRPALQALAPNLLTEADPNERAAKVDALVQYLLSIDGDATTVASPTSPGAQGGDFCAAPH